MKAYIHKAAASEALDCDLKSIVPDALMRRRMSRIVRDGVMAATVCAEACEIDAILTATAYGCLSDSEKFLAAVLDSDEQLLPPTPFIQSTFNTVGATIALLQQRHCYNMTYAHGAAGFGAALLDAVMLLEENAAQCVLVGAVEEITPTLCTLLVRMRVQEIPEQGGAIFFRLSTSPVGALAELGIEIDDTPLPLGYSDPLIAARALYRAVSDRQDAVLMAENIRLELQCI